MAPVFFASYARADAERSALFEAMQSLQLSTAAKLGTGAPPDQVAFIDLSSLHLGEQWSDGMTRALQSAKVFVAFCSNRYFNRKFCAIEFEVFLRRVRKLRFAGPCVLPVIWDRCELPTVLKQYQFAANDLPPLYEKEGLRAVRLASPKQYTKIIERLATVIVKACEDPTQPTLPPLVEAIDLAEIEASFGAPDGGPGHLHVGVLHPEGPRWEVDIGHPVRRLLERCPTLQQRGWTPLRIDASAAKRFEELRSRRSAVLLISPLDAFRDPLWKAYVGTIDKELAHAEATCSLLIGASPGTTATDVLATIAPILPVTVTKSDRIDLFELSTPASLLHRINSLAAAMEIRAIQAAPATRATDTPLENAATAAGLPLTCAPVIRGPGGAS